MTTVDHAARHLVQSAQMANDAATAALRYFQGVLSEVQLSPNPDRALLRIVPRICGFTVTELCKLHPQLADAGGRIKLRRTLQQAVAIRWELPWTSIRHMIGPARRTPSARRQTERFRRDVAKFR